MSPRIGNGLLAALLLAGGCGDAGTVVEVPGRQGAVKTAADERAERRLFDGAPPVIPHATFNADCGECHNERGVSVPDVGFSPPSPHRLTRGMSDASHCRQCHVFRRSETLFTPSTFAGLRQDLRRGRRLHPEAPPVIPHAVFMRENCFACHSGRAAREEIRTSHPERARCRQCHVEQHATSTFPG